MYRVACIFLSLFVYPRSGSVIDVEFIPGIIGPHDTVSAIYQDSCLVFVSGEWKKQITHKGCDDSGIGAAVHRWLATNDHSTDVHDNNEMKTFVGGQHVSNLIN